MKLITTFISFLAAMPISVGAYMASVSYPLPTVIRLLISPGTFAQNILLSWFPSRGFDLFKFMGTALLINLLMYMVIVYFVVRRFTRRIKLPKSQNFWAQS